jgi:MFS family permease
MKIDLVGPKQRGLAMGLNEFAGYLALSLSALATGYLAATYGLRPAPFLPGIALCLVGTYPIDLNFVHDTTRMQTEAKAQLLPSFPSMSRPRHHPFARYSY